jgi:parallel beta-helix repeat protein
MNHSTRAVVLALLLGGFLTGCTNTGTPTADQPPASKPKPPGITLHPGPTVQADMQMALIQAKPGDTIQLEEGTYEFTQGLSLAVEGVTIRGRGMDKTTLSFKKQTAGSAGLTVTRGKFLLEDLSVDDAKGDAVKVNDADGVTFRHVRAQWTGGEKETNGAYGLYPVQCKNVLIEDCVAFGASDAGIYVGQSSNVIIRNCRAERNVAGIEIENCIDADAYDNIATNNAGGLLVFDLPGLQVKNGKRVRVFHNDIFANNHANFAPKGNTVAMVAPGTGLTVMATHQVEVFDNTVKDNQTHGLLIVSYLTTGLPLKDKEYDPFPESIYVHDNTFSGCGQKPGGPKGELLTALLDTPLPEIVYDGIRNPAKLENGKLPKDLGVYFKNNRAATFANLHWDAVDPKDLLDPKKLDSNRSKVEKNIKPYEGELPPLPPVALK